jgi:poly(beta-D-mannuronate) lyase
LHPVVLTDAKYDCPTVAVLPHDIVAYDYYSDAKHSIVDPNRYAAYQAASKQFGGVEDAAERAADEFQKSGSREAAACAAQILLAQAHADAMTGSMSSNQAYYVQNWAMGALAVAWLKVRPAGPAALGLSPAQTTALTTWMKTVADQVRDYFEGMHQKNASSGRNNHYYWAGFAGLSAGIAANDRSLYNWGIDTYKFGVDQIQSDGTLPLEMARGQRALHYHLFALAPLVTMAELASANNDDLYAYDNSRLKLLVDVSVAGLADNHFFAEKAGVAQDTPKGAQISVSDIAWISPYARRFPSSTIAALLAHVTIGPDRYLGGMPLP